MTLLDRLTSFIFSEPEEPTEKREEVEEKPTITKSEVEENYKEILENLRFDGKDYKSLYKSLLRYFELKPRPEPFSSHERKLIKEIVDSVTEKGEPLIRLKTTSILKRKRPRPIPKAIPKIGFEKKTEIEEEPLGKGKIFPEAVEKNHEIPIELPKQEIKPPIVPRKAFIIRGNGQRAKIFSARFDEDYEEPLAPQEPIQIRKDLRPPIFPDRPTPTFKTQDTIIPKRYEMLLKEEADILMSQKKKPEFGFSPKPSQELSTQKSMTFSPPIEPIKKPFFSIKAEEPPIKKEEVKPFKFEFKAEPKPSEAISLTTIPKPATTEPKKELMEKPKSFSFPEKSSSSLLQLPPEIKSQPETTPFVPSEIKSESKESGVPGFKLGIPTGKVSEDQSKPFTFDFSAKPAPSKPTLTQAKPLTDVSIPKDKVEFAFGIPTSAATQESKKEESKLPTFSFDGGGATTAGAPFVFGSQPSQPPSSSQTTPFQFSFGSPPSQLQPTQPLSFGSPTTSSFNLGPTQSQPPQSPIAFTQTQTSQQPQFTFGSQPSQISLGSQPTSQFSFGSTQSFQSQPLHPTAQAFAQVDSEGNIPSSPFSTTSTSGRKISQPILKRKR